ncbi:MAG TPA: hypothetical protein DCW76_00545 [Lysinibacillus sp.]|nr:hypothetical protein [Lysinibacillus sp.]
MKDMMLDIKGSEVLKSLDVHFFGEPFRVNSSIPKKIDYFIADSSSDYSYANLRKVVKELDFRIDFFTKKQEQEV